jgi:hypothetical protein
MSMMSRRNAREREGEGEKGGVAYGLSSNGAETRSKVKNTLIDLSISQPLKAAQLREGEDALDSIDNLECARMKRV